MATEKLTIVSPISVRFSETGLRELDGLAAIEGMERGEFIRHLVAQEKKRQHSIWLARNALFSCENLDATNTASYKVAHE